MESKQAGAHVFLSQADCSGLIELTHKIKTGRLSKGRQLRRLLSIILQYLYFAADSASLNCIEGWVAGDFRLRLVFQIGPPSCIPKTIFLAW